MTSAEEVMFYPALVCLSLCLSVCLLATSRKKPLTGSLLKILPEKYLGTRRNWLNFGSHFRLDPDPGIFKRNFEHCMRGHFSAIWLISLETLSGSS